VSKTKLNTATPWIDLRKMVDFLRTLGTGQEQKEHPVLVGTFEDLGRKKAARFPEGKVKANWRKERKKTLRTARTKHEEWLPD